MSKTSYLLVVIFIIIVVCFFAASFLFPNTTKLPSVTKGQTETEQTAQSILSLSPATQTLRQGQSSFVDVLITNQNASPETIQLEIGYDPYTITPIAVTPGKYFSEQTVLLNSINPRNSRISFAVTCTNKPSPCGTDPAQSIARISFTVSPLAVKKETAINILPKTLIESSQSDGIQMKTTNMRIIIQGIPEVQASPSAMILPQ